MKKISFTTPQIKKLGPIEKIVGQGGANNNDGWYYSRLPLL
ncbi:hypothetical protein [Paenibacillus popilliae]|uniref:Uncharacterized protein n=1 Tax=Paenibacillus popilliae ATCC 14706 TaxID=1212764 RepID=M9LHN6_PAEPP|nr:hypothetical protein [Paenibacillus popilliae]GAC42395.1 hypothetical protein PPOP_1752 [Paenibacillus popilliae ATCC 14706]